MTIDVPVLDGEEWWASQAIDDTDSLIRGLLDLTNFCIELKIKVEESKTLHTELSRHNNRYNIDLETDKWIAFCASLSETEISDLANKILIILKAYSEKHFNKDLR